MAWSGTTGTPDVTLTLWEVEGGLFGDGGVVGRGHRLNLMNDTYREIGIGVIEGVFVRLSEKQGGEQSGDNRAGWHGLTPDGFMATRAPHPYHLRVTATSPPAA